MMSPAWDDVFSPSRDLVQILIAQQFPELSHCALNYLGEGWDCVAYRCERWVFRFPRRPLGVTTLSTEISILPQLGWNILVGKESPAFPYPFLATPFQEGTCLEFYEGPRSQLAHDLGTFLAGLHGRPVPQNLEVDGLDKLDLSKRVPQIQKHLGKVPDWVPTQAIESHQLTLVHGDLYCRHVYVNETGGLAGVIDWGDLHRGHPSVDLACGWSLFEGHNREAFWQAYGPVDEETVLWSRFRALYHTLLVRDYAQHQQMPELLSECERGLSRIL